MEGVDEEEEGAAPLYRPEACGGRGTRGDTINVAQTAEATQRRQSQARLRRRIDAGSLPGGPDETSAGYERTLSASAQCPRRRIRGAYLGQVCVSADGPVTLRRPAGEGARRISSHGGRKRPFASRRWRCPNYVYVWLEIISVGPPG